MKKYLKKLLGISLCLLMLMSLIPAYAEGLASGTKVYITSNTLNAYKSQSTDSTVLGVMTYGESMTMLSSSGDWVRIRNSKGQIGFCKLTGLSTQNPNKLNAIVYAKVNRIPVYQKPGTTYKRIANVRQNYPFNVIAATPDGKWYRVKNGSRYGYVQTGHVSQYASSKHGAIVTRTVWVNSENASSVYSGMGSGRNMGLISHGQAFTLLSSNGQYSQIRNSKGQIGWCRSEILTTANPNNVNATMYAQVSGSYLYNNSIIKGSGKYIAKGAKVTMVAESPDGGWCRVKYGGRYYYVSSILLSDEPAPEGGRTVYSKTDEYLYAKPSLSAKKVCTIEAYDELQLIGVSKGGAMVRTMLGKTGYIPIGLLEPSVWTFAAPKR